MKELIATWLPVGVLAAGIIASWARSETNQTNTVKEMTKLESRVDEIERNTDMFREGIKVDIAEVKTTMKFILEAIRDFKKK